ncbi:MAG: C39 family peptidase [Acidobacteria bacterium]|nr:C39 family peptidase [Acidobacteriota bacterium]MBU4307439.1 C39 family peptidase [Acidobacteriota bacterium]MCG2811241.1 C39 family peptidase [Candidatus Aminicenantes bacterium]
MHHQLWRGTGRTIPDAVILPVTGVRQHGNQCGPAALSTILNAASDPVSEKQIAAAVQNREAKASLTIDLLLYARQRGFPADFERSSIDRLLKYLENGQPCLLLLELRSAIGGKGKPLWHYVVAYGFSRSKQLVYIHSGVGAKRMNFKMLEKSWKPGDYWLMHLGNSNNYLKNTIN